MVITQDGTVIENGESRPVRESDFDRLVCSADAFAELWPEHVGIGLQEAMTDGIPQLGLSGTRVTAMIARRVFSNRSRRPACTASHGGRQDCG